MMVVFWLASADKPEASATSARAALIMRRGRIDVCIDSPWGGVFVRCCNRPARVRRPTQPKAKIKLAMMGRQGPDPNAPGSNSDMGLVIRGDGVHAEIPGVTDGRRSYT